MDKKNIKEMLTRTMKCKVCNGTGGRHPELSQSYCEKCLGTGIELDNKITDVLVKNGLRGMALTEAAQKIFAHIQNKLIDSYERGVADGKSEKTE